MSVGDDALAAGFALVPDSGEEGRVRWGAREINRTRDYTAQVKGLIPVGKPAYRAAAGITYGSVIPPNTYGSDGDVYFQIL